MAAGHGFRTRRLPSFALHWLGLSFPNTIKQQHDFSFDIIAHGWRRKNHARPPLALAGHWSADASGPALGIRSGWSNLVAGATLSHRRFPALRTGLHMPRCAHCSGLADFRQRRAFIPPVCCNLSTTLDFARRQFVSSRDKRGEGKRAGSL